jgi:hypothetical protein
MGCTGSKTAAAPVQKVEGDFKVTLERASDEQALGVTFLNHDIDGGLLAIEAIKEEGLLPEYNVKANENAPEQQVKVGDRIIAVNTVTCDLEKMKAELKQKTVVLTVQRAPAEPVVSQQEVAEKKAEEAAPTESVAAEPVEEPVAAPEPVSEEAAPVVPGAEAEEPAAAVAPEPAATASEPAVALAGPAPSGEEASETVVAAVEPVTATGGAHGSSSSCAC